MEYGEFMEPHNHALMYFHKLAAASDRVKFEQLGKSTMGAPFVLATISAPENLARLEEYKKIQDLLADPRKLGQNPDRPSACPKPAPRAGRAREGQSSSVSGTPTAVTCG